MLHYYGWVFRFLYPSLIWRVKTKEKKIYLTFDDGPIPEVTEFILAELEKADAKATFFCVGDNIIRYPSIFNQLIIKGHEVGNHTFNHLKGIITIDNSYYEDTEKCQELMNSENPTKLFRPPYGKIKRRQIKYLRDRGYKIIMWEVLAGDFLDGVSPQKCLKKLIKHTRKGSIVVLHDSLKTFDVVKEVLPSYLSYFKNKGYEFHAL